MYRERLRFKTSSRGAASVEAVVALPVFVIIFISLFFIRGLNSAKLHVDQEARRCAWQYAFNNCKRIPPGCDGVVSQPSWGEIEFDIRRPSVKGADVLADGARQASTGKGNYLLAGAESGKSAIKRVLSGIVTKGIAQALTNKFDTNKVSEVERPGLFGGGTSQVIGKYRLACNINPQGRDGVVTTVWNEFKP